MGARHSSRATVAKKTQPTVCDSNRRTGTAHAPDERAIRRVYHDDDISQGAAHFLATARVHVGAVGRRRGHHLQERADLVASSGG